MKGRIQLGALILIAGAVLITACGTQTGKGTKIYTGTKAFEMQFLKIPTEVYENEKFLVSMRTANAGAYDIENAYIVLALEQEYMALESWETETLKRGSTNTIVMGLAGRSETNLKGDSEITTLRLRAGKLEQQAEVHTTAVYMSACYPYTTRFSEPICLDTDIYGSKAGQKACTAKESYTYSSQGAPVAITKIEATMSPMESKERALPEIRIYLKNKGNGEVINNYAEFCTGGGIRRDELNTVRIVKASLSDKPLSCTPRAIKLGKTDEFIKCTVPEGLDARWGAYLAAVSVELEYGYSFTISKQVRIRRLVQK